MHRLGFDILVELQVVKHLKKLLGRRWGLGLGFVFQGGTATPPCVADESICQAVQSCEAGRAACRTTAEHVSKLFADQHSRGDLEKGALSYTCHAGLHEIAVPVGTDGELLGCLLAGGFLPADDAETTLRKVDEKIAPLALPTRAYEEARGRHPRLTWQDVSYANELLELGAEEMAAYSADMLRLKKREEDLERELGTRYRYDSIIGHSAPMQELYRLLDRVIDSDSTVLIQGENGTGKELIARAIHYNSIRKDGPFVAQNCSALNDNLLDSELFGHKRGAFTGAVADKQGLFELANGGTFFLDEIGDMSPALQVKLLRVVQEGTFFAVGDTVSRKVDVRIVAATNRDLKNMVGRGAFREDLYYRVHVLALALPPLRERREDIPLLVEHFVKKHARGGSRSRRVTKSCLNVLMGYAWPGNVRELENEIERLLVLAGDDRLLSEELLSPRLRRDEEGAAPEGHDLPRAVAALEKTMILESLKRHRGNKTRVADELKISRRNLIRLVKKYSLEKA